MYGTDTERCRIKGVGYYRLFARAYKYGFFFYDFIIYFTIPKGIFPLLVDSLCVGFFFIMFFFPLLVFPFLSSAFSRKCLMCRYTFAATTCDRHPFFSHHIVRSVENESEYKHKHTGVYGIRYTENVRQPNVCICTHILRNICIHKHTDTEC